MSYGESLPFTYDYQLLVVLYSDSPLDNGQTYSSCYAGILVYDIRRSFFLYQNQ